MKLLNKVATCVLSVGSLAGFTAMSAPRGAVSFINECTKEPTALTTPCGTQVKFELKDLNPDQSVEVQIEYLPAWSKDKAHRVFRRKFKPNDELAWSEKRNFHLFDEQSAEPDYQRYGRQWKVVMQWKQGNEVANRGSTESYIFMTPKNTRSFFAAKSISKDDRVCTWRTPIELLSGYLHNREAFDLEVSHEVDLRPQLAANGLQVNAKLDVATNWEPKFGPLLENADFGNHWFIAGLSQYISTGYNMTVKLNKMIPQNQGGHYILRTIYNRYLANHLMLEDKSGLFSSHYEWAHVSDGFIDVPEVVTEFAFVPLAEAGSIRKSLEVLELTVTPTNNNCVDKGFDSGNSAFKVEGAANMGAPLYFYPQG